MEPKTKFIDWLKMGDTIAFASRFVLALAATIFQIIVFDSLVKCIMDSWRESIGGGLMALTFSFIPIGLVIGIGFYLRKSYKKFKASNGKFI